MLPSNHFRTGPVFDAPADSVLRPRPDAARRDLRPEGSPVSAHHIVARLSGAILTLLITWTVVFGAMRLAPGDPVLLMLQGTPISDQAMDAARAKLGLDRPLIVQYVSFLADAARGDLGDSFRSRQPVTRLIAAEFPYTLQLAIGGFMIGVLLGS